MHDDIAAICVRIFRKSADLDDTPRHAGMIDAEVIAAPIEMFELDSLSTMEFIMAIEDAFHVELDEGEVNRCHNIAELATLIGRTRV